MWVTDLSNTLWDTYGELASPEEPYDRIFAILRGTAGPAPSDGFGATYTAALTIDEVVYVADEGHDCSLDVTAFWARGAGNEPFWSFVVSQSGITFTSLGGDDSEWNEVRTTVNDDTTHFDAVGSKNIVIDITTHPCSDTMSGAFHGYSAAVTYDNRTFNGCVIRGAGSPPTNSLATQTRQSQCCRVRHHLKMCEPVHSIRRHSM